MPYPLCRHIKTTGLQCQSPALTGGPHCFFHARLYARHSGFRHTPETRGYLIPGQHIELAPLEDCESIQLSLSVVINALATGQLDVKRATALLYGLSIASVNARRLTRGPYAPALVRSAERTPDGIDLAQPGLTALFPDEFDDDDEDDDDEEFADGESIADVSASAPAPTRHEAVFPSEPPQIRHSERSKSRSELRSRRIPAKPTHLNRSNPFHPKRSPVKSVSSVKIGVKPCPSTKFRLTRPRWIALRVRALSFANRPVDHRHFFLPACPSQDKSNSHRDGVEMQPQTAVVVAGERNSRSQRDAD